MSSTRTSSPYARRRLRLRRSLFGWAAAAAPGFVDRVSLGLAVEARAVALDVHGLSPRDWRAAVLEATDAAWEALGEQASSASACDPAASAVDELGARAGGAR